MKTSVAIGCVFGMMVVGAATPEELVEFPVSKNLRGHENTEWSSSDAYHLTDERRTLPRVLLVGDSICQGYRSGVCAALEGRMTVTFWASSYCVTSPCYLKFLSIYLDEAEYAVIHFNNGLHSLNSDPVAWERAFRKAIRLIRTKQPKARLVWAPSTPLRDPARTAKAKALNAIAAKVIAEYDDIALDDLFTLMDPCDRNKDWMDVYHFRPHAVARQAQQVVSCCLRAAGLENAKREESHPRLHCDSFGN